MSSVSTCGPRYHTCEESEERSRAAVRITLVSEHEPSSVSDDLLARSVPHECRRLVVIPLQVGQSVVGAT